MPEPEAAGVSRKALKFTGDVKAGKYVPGIPAHSLTQEQATDWLSDAAYQEAVQSPHYEEVDAIDPDQAIDATRPARLRAAQTKAAADAQRDAEGDAPKRRSKKEE